jgi:hypothetical protein
LRDLEVLPWEAPGVEVGLGEGLQEAKFHPGTGENIST